VSSHFDVLLYYNIPQYNYFQAADGLPVSPKRKGYSKTTEFLCRYIPAYRNALPLRFFAIQEDPLDFLRKKNSPCPTHGTKASASAIPPKLT
jgi:hypothetical protein